MTDPAQIVTDALAGNDAALAAFAELRGKPDDSQLSRDDSQLSRDDLKTMTPEQIVTAKDAGQLNDLLGGAA